LHNAKALHAARVAAQAQVMIAIDLDQAGVWPQELVSQWSCKLQIIRRYHIQNRDDYKKYNKICGTVTKLVSVIKRLDPKDPTRIELTDQMLDK